MQILSRIVKRKCKFLQTMTKMAQILSKDRENATFVNCKDYFRERMVKKKY